MQLEITAGQAAKLAPLIAAFTRGIQRQQQRDGEIGDSLLRWLRSPDNAQRLREIMKGENRG
jgi:hypothetical protein